MSYKEGIYEHVKGVNLGSHSVKIVGWGVDDSGVKYWIAANSWGKDWGMDGYFWFKED